MKNFKNLSELNKITQEAKKILESNNNDFLIEIGKLLNRSWHIKKKLSHMVSNSKIEKLALIQEEQNHSIEALGSQCQNIGGSVSTSVSTLQVRRPATYTFSAFLSSI